jgi:hypothetical protein
MSYRGIYPRDPVLFLLGRMGEVGFFGFSMCSHQVPSVFHQVPNSLHMFPSSQCVLQHVPNGMLLCPLCFVQSCPIGTYSGGWVLPRLVCFYVGLNTSILGSLQSLRTSFVMGQSKRLIAPGLINMRHTICDTSWTFLKMYGEMRNYEAP